MNKSNKLLIFTLLVSLAMLSCKDSKKDSGDSFPEFLHGVWQDEFYDDGDELGIYFSADSLGFWDYYGDEFDQGEDCYDAMYYAEIISYEGDEYRIRYNEDSIIEDEEPEDTITLKVDGDELIVTAEVDGDDMDFPYSKDSKTVSDFTPLCEGFTFKANSNLESKRQKVIDLLSK